MLLNPKYVSMPDGSSKITASLFVNKHVLPMAPPTVTMKDMPAGTNPGDERELYIEVLFPKKAAVVAAVGKPAQTDAQRKEAAAKAQALLAGKK
jgi:hypothetical protein